MPKIDWDSFINTEGHAVIPNWVDRIEEGAYQNSKNLWSIYIPCSVKSIDEKAFDHCRNLEIVEIADGVEEIYDDAFNSCVNLESVTLPSTLTKLGHGAFADCDSLHEINIPKGITQISPFTFSGCQNLQTITIPEGVHILCESAFAWCINLRNVELPSTLAVVDNCAFEECFAISCVVAASIPSWLNIAFHPEAPNPICWAKSLYTKEKEAEHILIPNNITEIKNFAFEGHEGLLSVEFQENSIVKSIGRNAFFLCKNLEAIELPNGVTSIYSSAFQDCESLRSITIPASVTSIGWDAFKCCYENIAIHYGGPLEDWRTLGSATTCGLPAKSIIFCSNGCLDCQGNEIEPPEKSELAEER